MTLSRRCLAAGVVVVTLLLAWVSMQATASQAQPQVAPIAPEAPGEPLKVMSFNIRYGTANDGDNHWLKRRAQLFALLRDQRADVIGVQEALDTQLDDIVREVPGYGYVGVGRADGRRAGEFAAILYRTDRLQVRRSDTFWFSDTPAAVKSTSWGNRIERVCTWGYFEDRLGPAFYLFNVHLDHESQPSRERSAALLLSRIAARAPFAPAIVTGDFNAGEQNPATQAMRAVFPDSFRVRHPADRVVGTFNGFEAGRVFGDKIDYIFVEPGTEVLDAAIVRRAWEDRYPSDHFPVTARLRLR